MTCQHVLTARHCVAMTDLPGIHKEAAAFGYLPDEILSPDLVRVGLGSNIYVGAAGGSDAVAVVNPVQQIRAAESPHPDLAVLVLSNGINPTLPNIRPAMIFMDGHTDAMGSHDNFTAIGWGRTGSTTSRKMKKKSRATLNYPEILKCSTTFQVAQE